MLYTLLVFAAPPLLFLLGTGRTAPRSPADVQFPWNVVDGGFPFAAWQLPFAMV
jgi:hypothetical protein